MLKLLAITALAASAANLVDTAPKPSFESLTAVNLLGPVTSGGAAKRLDPPAAAEMLRAARLDKLADVSVVTELIADYTDSPRVYPLVGIASRHVSTYRVTVNHRQGRQVLRVVHQHLHLEGR